MGEIGVERQGCRDKMQVAYRDRVWTFNAPMTVAQMLQHLDVLPEGVLVVRNGQLVTEDHFLKPGDTVKVVAVISGG